MAAASAAGLNRGGLKRAAFSMGDLQVSPLDLLGASAVELGLQGPAGTLHSKLSFPLR